MIHVNAYDQSNYLFEKQLDHWLIVLLRVYIQTEKKYKKRVDHLVSFEGDWQCSGLTSDYQLLLHDTFKASLLQALWADWGLCKQQYTTMLCSGNTTSQTGAPSDFFL